MKIFLIILNCLFVVPSLALAENISDKEQFLLNNPDGGKYAFVKDYLMGLTYLKASSVKFANRQDELARIVLNDNEINAQVKFLIKDNIDWRIAKNLVQKYRLTNNGLMLKAVDLFVRLCNEQIEYNNQERALWNQFLRGDGASRDVMVNSVNFEVPLRNIETKRRESWQKLLEASVFVSKVLLSNQLDYRGEMTYLGITKEERVLLLDRLDGFPGEGFRGTMREGQTFLEASVSVIRETLEQDGLKPLNLE